MDVTPRSLVEDAVALDAKIVVSTYNEPLITSEWAVAVFKEAKAAGLMTALRVERQRHAAGARVHPPVDRLLQDRSQELRRSTLPARWAAGSSRSSTRSRRCTRSRHLARNRDPAHPGLQRFATTSSSGSTAFVAGVSPDIPWHVTAFHQDYKMRDPADTTPEMLMRAAAIGRAAGLRYVYAGNLPGQVGDLEDTRCPSCGTMLVERSGYFVRGYHLTPDGGCPTCGTRVPGLWGSRFEGQITSRPFIPGTRRLRTASAESVAIRRDSEGRVLNSGKDLPRIENPVRSRTPPSRAS